MDSCREGTDVRIHDFLDQGKCPSLGYKLCVSLKAAIEGHSNRAITNTVRATELQMERENKGTIRGRQVLRIIYGQCVTPETEIAQHRLEDLLKYQDHESRSR